ncbi:hypothetical protein PG997_014257 [Apiospora hydei]|uniref:Uncharacterized protein n=1 Tax=Apiospora hydei TaxID=1337664 RepID=A0ABR1UTB7_9PEZI
MCDEGLEKLGTPPFRSARDVGKYAIGLLKVMQSAQSASVPLKPRFSPLCAIKDSEKAKRIRKSLHEAREQSKKRCHSRKRMRVWLYRLRLHTKRLLETRTHRWHRVIPEPDSPQV